MSLFRPLFVRSALLAVLLPVSAGFAWAGPDQVPPLTDPIAKKECGACHLAFQPKFLSAEAWGQILETLGTHFGENASLDAKTAATIRAAYVAGAGRSQKGVLRISEQSWWLMEHRGVGQSKFAAVKSKANCSACHKQAEAGNYEDR